MNRPDVENNMIAPKAIPYEQSMKSIISDKGKKKKRIQRLLLISLGSIVTVTTVIGVLIAVSKRQAEKTEQINHDYIESNPISIDQDQANVNNDSSITMAEEKAVFSEDYSEKFDEFMTYYKAERMKYAMAGNNPGNATEVEDIEISVFEDSDFPVSGHYLGTVVDGKPEGWGIFVSFLEKDDSSKYVIYQEALEAYNLYDQTFNWVYFGHWKDGKMDGDGKTLWAMQYFEGDYENDYEKYGTIRIFGTDYHYTGEFRNGEPCGKGIVYYDSGDFFTGTFTDALTGSGVYTATDGTEHVAYFENGQLQYYK